MFVANLLSSLFFILLALAFGFGAVFAISNLKRAEDAMDLIWRPVVSLVLGVISLILFIIAFQNFGKALNSVTLFGVIITMIIICAVIVIGFFLNQYNKQKNSGPQKTVRINSYVLFEEVETGLQREICIRPLIKKDFWWEGTYEEKLSEHLLGKEVGHEEFIVGGMSTSSGSGSIKIISINSSPQKAGS